MNIPGFTAQASLREVNPPYPARWSPPPGASVTPQLASGNLSGSDLQWCRLACLYCRYTGYYCWPCFICALIISTGGISDR
jgi:hypothetical protein